MLTSSQKITREGKVEISRGALTGLMKDIGYRISESEVGYRRSEVGGLRQNRPRTKNCHNVAQLPPKVAIAHPSSFIRHRRYAALRFLRSSKALRPSPSSVIELGSGTALRVRAMN